MPRRKLKFNSEPDVSVPVVGREYLNVKQAAEYLGCTASAIHLAFGNGLPRKRVGIRDIVRRADVDTYFNSLPDFKA